MATINGCCGRPRTFNFSFCVLKRCKNLHPKYFYNFSLKIHISLWDILFYLRRKSFFYFLKKFFFVLTHSCFSLLLEIFLYFKKADQSNMYTHRHKKKENQKQSFFIFPLSVFYPCGGGDDPPSPPRPITHFFSPKAENIFLRYWRYQFFFLMLLTLLTTNLRPIIFLGSSEPILLPYAYMKIIA